MISIFMKVVVYYASSPLSEISEISRLHIRYQRLYIGISFHFLI